MVGRAGRPGLSDRSRPAPSTPPISRACRGVAVIMTADGTEPRFESLIQGLEPAKSVLLGSLRELLNTEVASSLPATAGGAGNREPQVVLDTVRSLSSAVQWLRTTLYYQQLRSRLGDERGAEEVPPLRMRARASRALSLASCQTLRGELRSCLNALSEAECVQWDGRDAVSPLPLGRIMVGARGLAVTPPARHRPDTSSAPTSSPSPPHYSSTSSRGWSGIMGAPLQCTRWAPGGAAPCGLQVSSPLTRPSASLHGVTSSLP